MKLKKILVLALCCVMAVGLLPAVSFADDSVTRILACSDFQNPDGNDAGKQVVSAVVRSIQNNGVDAVDAFFCCGDYDHDLTMLPGPTAEGVKALGEAVSPIVPDGAQKVFVQGNHDCASGLAGLAVSGNNDPKSGKYGLFVINEDDYSWFNASREVVKGTAENLKTYLNEKLESGFTAPVFVLSHLPLHYSYRSRLIGDGRWAHYIFDVLNEAGEKGLNIIFLFGHDHSNGWDDYLGGACICLEKGDSINIGKLGNTLKWDAFDLNFTYMNAGYTGYYDNHNGADDALTMTVFEITDTQVTVNRYDAEGLHNVASAGKRNDYKNETGYEPNTDVKASPVVIPLTAVADSSPMESALDRLAAFIMRIYEFLKKTVASIC
ncbi:MAG: metallophosphoesterase [Clostridia bacterium]|nr:metallophosphoesterase [Clostridia bacterium]